MRNAQSIISALSRMASLLVLVGASPILVVLSFLILFFSGWPIIYVQERVGKGGKTFKMYKFRTMRVGAEKEQGKYRSLNEADGPVFKIKNDPRLTKIGKVLCRSGLDELPQLFNIVKGEMALVGPRPLPINEAGMIDKKYRLRESVLPGIISVWVVNGHHQMRFEDWMKSDVEYAKNKNLKSDAMLIMKGAALLLKLTFREVKNLIPVTVYRRWNFEQQEQIR